MLVVNGALKKKKRHNSTKNVVRNAPGFENVGLGYIDLEFDLLTMLSPVHMGLQDTRQQQQPGFFHHALVQSVPFLDHNLCSSVSLLYPSPA